MQVTGGSAGATLEAPLVLEDIPALKRSFWKHNLLEAAPELTLEARVGGAPARLTGVWFDRAVV